MKLLLHVCCAPCALQPFLELVNNKNDVTGFFYNPNIYPIEEYQRRLGAIKKFSIRENFPVIFGEHESELFFTKISYPEKLPAKERCPICWQLRLEKAAGQAKENKFDCFTTTLLTSPYQDHEQIKKIGLGLSDRYKIDFYYQDFRPLFRKSQDQARQRELYRQKYCGCVFSQTERKQKEKFKVSQQNLC